MAGSLMKYYEQQILNLTNGARKQLMQKCMETILFDENGNSRFEYNVVVAIVLAGAKIGVGREAPLNQQEKELSKIIAKKVFRNYTEEEVVNAIESFALKTTYNVVSALTAIADQDVAMAYFHYILCWALADGVIDDAMEGKIESLFGMKLILDFADNGPESVPTPKIQLTGLEAEIALWLKNDDQAVFFHDVQSHFPRKTNSEIKKALDSLCEKGVLSCVKTFAGDMYSLENDNIHINAVAENRAPKAPEKPKANQPSAAQRENERIKQAILEHLKSGQLYMISDMIIEVEACSGLSTPKMAELLRQMEKEGLVERIVDGKKTYFRTCGAGNSISAAKNRASATSGSAAKSRESATSGSAMPLTAAQRENERIKQAILAHLKAGQLYMISDMIIEVEACSGLSTPKMAGLLRQMEKEGLVERIVDGKKAYFRTCGAGDSISATKNRASATSGSAVKKPKSAASDSAAKNRESATSGSAMPLTAAQRKDERIKQAILEHLKSSSGFCTVSDMITEVKACSGLSTPKVSGVLYMLEKEGLVERIVIDDTQYYYIK